MSYYIAAAISLGLLVMIPVWSPRNAELTYPIFVIVALAVLVVLVPIIFRRENPKRRKSDWMGG